MKMSLVEKVKANIGKAALVAAIPIIVGGCIEPRGVGFAFKTPPVHYQVVHCKNPHYHGNKLDCHPSNGPHSHGQKQRYHHGHKKHGHKHNYHHGHKHGHKHRIRIRW